MDYIEVRFFNDTALNEAIIAWLGENDFDMFEEREDGLNAYIDSKQFNEENLKDVLSIIPGSKENIRYQTSFIKDQNWNKKWESNFEPVLIAGRVFIRAPFHEPGKEFQHEIIIEPKMSFGTGHHATTALMIELMVQFDFKNKIVLDMGAGTGVLAILAEKLGANKITAVDVDEWAYKNCIENCERNNCTKVETIQGDVSAVNEKNYDIILANINRNILLKDIPKYSKLLNKGGELFLSGILTEDKEVINKRAEENGLNYITEAMHNNWMALYYKLS
jgi:ribosomal protein L11 methyltransferase